MHENNFHSGFIFNNNIEYDTHIFWYVRRRKKNYMHQPTTYAFRLRYGRSDVVHANNNNKNSNKTYNLTTFQWKSKWYEYTWQKFSCILKDANINMQCENKIDGKVLYMYVYEHLYENPQYTIIWPQPDSFLLSLFIILLAIIYDYFCTIIFIVVVL